MLNIRKIMDTMTDVRDEDDKDIDEFWCDLIREYGIKKVVKFYHILGIITEEGRKKRNGK